MVFQYKIFIEKYKESIAEKTWHTHKLVIISTAYNCDVVVVKKNLNLSLCTLLKESRFFVDTCYYEQDSKHGS